MVSISYFTILILFNINPFFTDSEVVTSIAIQHYSFICIQSNGSKEFQVSLFNTDNSELNYHDKKIQ